MRLVMVLAVVLAPLTAIAKQPPVAKVFLNTQYRSIDWLRELPPELAAAFRKYVHGVPVADRGEPFNATDVVDKNGPPQRRFLVAGSSPSGSFVAYEHGGRGHHYHLVLFGSEAPEPHRLTACAGISLDLPRGLGSRDGKKEALFSQLIQKHIAREVRAGNCDHTEANDF